jgi:hypothetical protein
MSTPAVTVEAPAVSKRTESTIDRHAEFLPSGKHYRMTGELPSQEADTEEASAASEKSEKEIQPGKEDASAASASDIAAASEAAKAAEEAKEENKGKTAASSESRWQKISRENKELRERLQRLETSAQPRDDKQASHPAAEVKAQPAAKAPGKPKIDDVDATTGKAKYANYAAYEDAKDTWLREDTIRQFQETSAKTTREQQQSQADRATAEGMVKKFEGTRAKYADFDQVALNPDLILPRGSVTDGFLLDSEHAGEVAYHLGQHPEILQSFYGDHDLKTGKFTNKITPQRQFRKLMEIEAKLTGSAAASSSEKASSAKPVTQAPRPPHQVSGKGTVTKDAVEQAVADSDQDTYMREQNARDLARRKKGK